MSGDDAEKVCQLMSPLAEGRESGFGRMANQDIAKQLKAAWPEFNWRVILNRSSEHSRWCLTIDDSDPREHAEFPEAVV